MEHHNRSGIARLIRAVLWVAVMWSGESVLAQRPDQTIAPTVGEESLRKLKGDGYDLSASLVPETSEIFIGQPLFVTFTLKNEGSTPFKFHEGGASRGSVRDNNYSLTAVDSAGREVPDAYGSGNWGGLGTIWELNPGQTYTARLFLPFWCRFREPGEYVVTGERTFVDGESRLPPVTIKASFRLRVTRDEGRVNALIEELGGRISGGSRQTVHDASFALIAIDSDRVIPHLAEAIARGDSFTRYYVIQELSRRQPSPLTRAALTLALSDTDLSVQRAAAQALSRLAPISK